MSFIKWITKYYYGQTCDSLFRLRTNRLDFKHPGRRALRGLITFIPFELHRPKLGTIILYEKGRFRINRIVRIPYSRAEPVESNLFTLYPDLHGLLPIRGSSSVFGDVHCCRLSFEFY